MERLTARTDDGIAYVVSETGTEGAGHFTTQRRLPEVISRLACYEDTGLEPSEITGLKSVVDEIREEVDAWKLPYSAQEKD